MISYILSWTNNLKILSMKNVIGLIQQQLWERCHIVFNEKKLTMRHVQLVLVVCRFFLLLSCLHRKSGQRLQINFSRHSHKKRKNSLEGSLDRVLFGAELEFLKMLVPRLPQHAWNVNIECAGKSEWLKQLYSLYVTSFLVHFYILILLFWF